MRDLTVQYIVNKVKLVDGMIPGIEEMEEIDYATVCRHWIYETPDYNEHLIVSLL